LLALEYNELFLDDEIVTGVMSEKHTENLKAFFLD